jgi:predicted NUDIX family phosphoesterase
MDPEQMIMVVERSKLFENFSFQGFKSHQDSDYQSVILNHYQFMKRGIAEENPNYKQPTGYVIIVNPELKKVFAYQRSAKGNEKRLWGKWSWGLGGHIEKFDVHNGNPIHTSVLRELEEEIFLTGNFTPKILGYINDDSNKVGEVHFGILYVVETNKSEITQQNAEIKVGNFMDLQELEQICNSDAEVEPWSRIALAPLKEYFNKL